MSPSMRFSNLTNFLRSVTPIVPSKPLPQSYLDDHEKSIWQLEGHDEIQYFTLGDVWKCYEEWSAYGVETPIVLNDHTFVSQYYAPYLSAIQIYTSKSSATSRNLRGEIDELEMDSSRDGTLVDSGIDHKGSLLGDIYFQYQEMNLPSGRIPFADKMFEFTKSHPALETLKSVDLSPASWMSIAWYPIYHIPAKGNVKDLSTIFLTYHTLSSSFQDSTWGNDCDDNGGKEKSQNGVPLPPFGLATLKMQGNVWINESNNDDYEKMVDLQGAANSWLKQLNFKHHDFNYFNMH